MMNNFLEIFGEYVATDKYRQMLRNTLFTDLNINKEDMTMTALLHVDRRNSSQNHGEDTDQNTDGDARPDNNFPIDH